MPDAEDARLAELLVEAAREASALALAMKARGFKQWTKAHASPVTDADIALDKLLKERLLAARPHFGWLSEETADNDARLNHREIFVVDPIDGTRAFAGGLPDWTVSLAVVRDGRPVAAVLAEPEADRIFVAALGHGATVRGRRAVASARDSFDGARLAGPRPMIEPAGRQGAILLPKVHSLALRLAKVAIGEVDAAFASANSSDWDLAAADLLVHEAGAILTSLDGAQVLYNQAQPVHGALIAAAQPLHSLLRDLGRGPRLRPSSKP